MRVCMELTNDGQELLEDYLDVPLLENTIMLPNEGWQAFARWVLIHIERCKFTGVTADGNVIGTETPEQIDFIEVDWSGPHIYLPDH